jgi:Uma2 family endonuclease
MSLAGPPSNDLTATFDLLALPEVRRQVHRMSVAEYQRLGATGYIAEKTELIRGVLVDKMSESPLHSFLATFLADWLRRGVTAEWRVREGHPLTLVDSEPEPDVAVVKQAAYAATHPKTAALVIEVAVTSEKLDQQKAAIYAEAGVDEYWIVLANRQCVEVHRSPAAGKYASVATLRVGDVLSPLAFPHLSLPVDDLFSAEQAAE